MCAFCQLPTNHEEIIYTANYLRTLYMVGYIDPGTGTVIASNLPAVLGAVLGGIGALFLFFKNRFFSLFSKKSFVAIVLVLIAAFAGIMFFVGKDQTKSSKKVIVLGFDGMDPNVLEEGWKKGLFPNLKKIADLGYYSKLGTTIPPQSPVAWASFITGKSPASHGIYDFIERDPKNYSLSLAFSNEEKNKQSQLKATPFWEIATKKGIKSTILFLPDTFEPPKSLSGELISGMGVPDILGTQGTFTLFSTKKYPTDSYTWRGKVIEVQKSQTINTSIEGPKYSVRDETKVATIPIEVKKVGKTAEINVQNKTIKLKEGHFSEWIRLEFKIDFLTRVRGIAKFYLKSTAPEFELYLSPINYDPDAPIRSISAPSGLSKKISQEIGLYSTLGLPHDTWALEENVFNEKAFLEQADSILTERKKIYNLKLNSLKDGLFFAYFGMPDTISHMFWRFKDGAGSYSQTINDYYAKMDEIVGQTVSRMPKDTTLFILSDHGFWSFDYEMNINSWLKDNGYLVLKSGKKGGPLYEDVDWSKTRAYAAGYNSVFFNVAGREKDGIVEQKDVDKLEKEIIEKLMGFNNPETGEKIMKKVYTRADMGISNSDSNAPDLVLGFYKGTRASWDSAIGAVTDYTIRKRESKWSGDHLFDPTEVPGVLLSNKKFNLTTPSIEDVMPYVMGIFSEGS